MRENDLGATTQSKGNPSGSGPWMAAAAGLLVVMSLALPWAKLESSQNGVGGPYGQHPVSLGMSRQSAPEHYTRDAGLLSMSRRAAPN